MVFTPLLTSACVGTLEFRSVAVPVMSLQKYLKEPQNKYYLASAENVDPEKKTVACKDEDGLEFSVPYDKLVIATGSQVTPGKPVSATIELQPISLVVGLFDCSRAAHSRLNNHDSIQGSTFGIPGVEKYAHPLRDISHANGIRNHLIANWSKANTPNRYWV